MKRLCSWCCYSRGYVWRFLIGRLSLGLWTGASRNGIRSVDERTSTVNKKTLLFLCKIQSQWDGQRGKKSTSVAQTLLLKHLDKHSWIAGELEASFTGQS